MTISSSDLRGLSSRKYRRETREGEAVEEDVVGFVDSEENSAVRRLRVCVAISAAGR